MAVEYEASSRIVGIAGWIVHATETLGRGGFGIVYRGKGTDGSTVAVKKISPRQKEHRDEIVSTLSRWRDSVPKHENIVNVLDVQNSWNSVWIFMEYCDHGNLNDFFRENRKTAIGLKDKLQLMSQIAVGISYLHENSIVHRDIKPENVLLKTEADKMVVKLTDFGVSQILDPDGLTSAMSSNVGTLTFKAPEFFQRGSEENIKYHRNVDVYAAGLTFMAMLQAKEGRNLQPEPEGPLGPYEKGMPIGMILMSRIANSFKDTTNIFDIYGAIGLDAVDIIVRVKVGCDEIVRKVLEMIRVMIHVNPGKRPTAAEVQTKLQALLGESSPDGMLAQTKTKTYHD